MQNKKRFAIGLVVSTAVLAFTVWAGIVVYALWDMRGIAVHLDIHPATPLTDELAVSLAGAALSQATGRSQKEFSPVPYSSNTASLFARNPHQPDNGYVLWFDKKSILKLRFHYNVSLEAERDKILAIIGRVK